MRKDCGRARHVPTHEATAATPRVLCSELVNLASRAWLAVLGVWCRWQNPALARVRPAALGSWPKYPAPAECRTLRPHQGLAHAVRSPPGATGARQHDGVDRVTGHLEHEVGTEAVDLHCDRRYLQQRSLLAAFFAGQVKRPKPQMKSLNAGVGSGPREWLKPDEHVLLSWNSAPRRRQLINMPSNSSPQRYNDRQA